MLELLLAVGVLGFALTSLLALFINCTILNRTNRNLIIATSHAQYVMEELKGQTSFVNFRNKIDSGTYTKFTDLPSESTTVCCCDAADVCYGPCPSENPQRICVTDSWKELGTRDRSVKLQTLITY